MKYSREDIEKYQKRAGYLGEKAKGYLMNADPESDIEYDSNEYDEDGGSIGFIPVRARMADVLSSILYRKLTDVKSDSIKANKAHRIDKVNDDPINTTEVLATIEYIDACGRFLKAPFLKANKGQEVKVIVPKPPAFAQNADEKKIAAEEKADASASAGGAVQPLPNPLHAAARLPADVGRFADDDDDPIMQHIYQEQQRLEDARRANIEAREQAQLDADIARAAAESLLDVNPRMGMWGPAPAAPHGPVVDPWGGAAGEAELRAMPPQAAAAPQARALPARGAVDPVRQQQFDQMVAKIKQIDIEVGKGRAVRKKDYLKGCFNEVLQEVKSHEAELLRHNLDVPDCLRKSLFIQECTGMREGSDHDLFAPAVLGLNEGAFDAIIH